MTEYLIVGSSALKQAGIQFRAPKDIDVFCIEHVEGFDCIPVTQEVLNLCETLPGTNCVTPDTVYTIKMSHLPWDIKFQKHKSDVLYLKSIGCKLLPDLYKALGEYWTKVNGNKPYLSLYQKKDDFFTDFVTYIYPHDDLHLLVAYPDSPMYTKVLKEGEEVAIDKSKFDALPLNDKLRLFQEEIVVVAIERWLVNPKCCGKYSWFQAYFLALHKTVTALTKGWASRFIVENIDYYNVPDFEYFRYALQTLKEGEIIMGKMLTSAQKAALLEAIAVEYNNKESAEKYGLYDLTDLPESEIWSELVFDNYLEKIVTILEQRGGEDCGRDYYAIFTFQGKTYKAQTWYASHYGVEWSDMEVYEVEAKQKTVTVYE